MRFTSPVPVGSEVRVNARLLSSEPKGDGILYKVGVQIEIKGQEKPAMVGEVLYLALGQPAAPADTDKEANVSEGGGPGLDEIFQRMQAEFQPDKASGVDASIQWLIKDGDAEAPYAVTIKDGQCSWEHGQAESPTVTLSTDRESFTALMTGKAQGPALYMAGKLRIQGDLMLAQRMGSFFA